ncbi:TetR/AcrR family transcriptional regulator [Microbacterium sp. 18062]|uniref:TetR/AcrR family transcriptional regulator n=1 Tax=Microbacterium sp. 18062 TaxID=2681410 RepID=UPI001F258711|nr:TetR/AcrR family transcriptional regulator [Microbacterium sp. 18062]
MMEVMGERGTAGRAGAPRARVGRPRATPRTDDGRSAKAQILDAAAELFTTRGYAATSTREIAERAGIRQASLYYHVSAKPQLLLELLDASVRPTLEGLDDLLARPDAPAALYALATRDVQTLLTAPHNLAVLYLTPELADPEFASLHEARGRLRAAYVDLARRIGGPGGADFRGAACLQLVELAIELRQRGEVPPDAPHDIALACLRVVEAHPHDIARVSGTAR